jgi:hypothetical protein
MMTKHHHHHCQRPSFTLTILLWVAVATCWSTSPSPSWSVYAEDNETDTDTDTGTEDNMSNDEDVDNTEFMKVLGEPAWTRLRPGWSLTVNDQCLYEFVFQFEHDETLPVGKNLFKEMCGFGDEDNGWETETAPDGKKWLEARQMYERFPEYVWATIGFNHLSVDWHPCGIRPTGYAEPQYAFSVRKRTRKGNHRGSYSDPAMMPQRLPRFS